ncbi:hypothetical protein GGD83_004635 [Rhodoblastus sphagnicola]|nr:hypothetical protein [Rhodoblastus sphagnicola]
MIGHHGRRRRAVGEQVGLRFLDPGPDQGVASGKASKAFAAASNSNLDWRRSSDRQSIVQCPSLGKMPPIWRASSTAVRTYSPRIWICLRGCGVNGRSMQGSVWRGAPRAIQTKNAGRRARHIALRRQCGAYIRAINEPNSGHLI